MEKLQKLDINGAMTRLRNNKKLYAMLLKKFDGASMLEDLKNKLANGDSTAAEAQAHTIKGVAANLSLDDLYAKAEAVESALKNGKTAAEINISEISESAAETMEAVNLWLSENA